MPFFAHPARTPAARTRAFVSSATALGVVLAGLSLGAIPLSAGAGTTSPLSSLKNFTVLTEGNFTTEGSAHEVEGSVAVGGDMIINKSYILASPHNTAALPLLESRSTQLLVNGALQINRSGEALNANAGVARIGIVDGYSVGVGGAPQPQGNRLIADTTPANIFRMWGNTTIADISAGDLFANAFGSAFAELRSNSSTIAGYTASDVSLISFIDGTNFNGISGNDKGLSLIANTVNVVRVTAAQISAVGTIKLLSSTGNQNGAVLPSASTLLIFDITDSGSVTMTAPEQNVSAQPYTLWNFANATALSVQGKGGSGYIKGSILAPNADVIFADGYIEGQIAVKSFVVRGGGEIHHFTYGGDLPTPRTVSATPTFADGTCDLSSRTNALTAPAVAHVQYTWTSNPTASLVGKAFASFTNSELTAGVYEFTIAAMDGYTLTGDERLSHEFKAPPIDCSIKGATGTITFSEPTCAAPTATYTLAAASNASYTVQRDKENILVVVGEAQPMDLGFLYTITTVANPGYTLTDATSATSSQQFDTVNCATASGSISFTTPTCEAPTASYTLNTPSHATYSVQRGDDAAVAVGANIPQPIDLGVGYAFTVVPDAGYSLSTQSDHQVVKMIDAPQCATATGSFAFSTPTCESPSEWYTLYPATNASYSVKRGADDVPIVIGVAEPMDLGVEYTITVVPNAGYTLVGGIASRSQMYKELTNCVTADAVGKFSFTSPTCDVAASFTLDPAVNASYLVTTGTGNATTVAAGTHPMDLDSSYTIVVVPDEGYSLATGVVSSDSQTYSAPANCASLSVEPHGSTCSTQGEDAAADGATSWIWVLIDDRVSYTIDGSPERITTPFVEVTPGVHIARAAAAPGFVLAAAAAREWTITVVDSAACGGAPVPPVTPPVPPVPPVTPPVPPVPPVTPPVPPVPPVTPPVPPVPPVTPPVAPVVTSAVNPPQTDSTVLAHTGVDAAALLSLAAGLAIIGALGLMGGRRSRREPR